jgi:dipeptide transport system permease protein
MNTATDAAKPATPVDERPGRLAEFWFYFRENRGAVIGMWVFVAFVLVALLAGVIAPYDPTQQFREHLLQPPFWQEGGELAFPLGTDAVGRDMLSRLLHGARYSFYVGIIVVAVSALGGVMVGLFAGFAPKWVDTIIMRVMDIILAFPSLLLRWYWWPFWARR